MKELFGIEAIYFIFMGLFGAILHVIIKSKSWKDFWTFESGKRVLLGPCCGFVYHLLYSEYSYPNGIMALVSGYFGTDFIVSLMEKLRETKDE